MAFRTWGRLLLAALGVSLLAGAGQLGIAFGFGIVRFTGTFTGGTVNQWPAQLVWVGWFAANAAVVGAVLTERLARRDGGLAGTGRSLAVAGAAALGATVVAPLCMQPARAAELVSVDPVWAVGICAVLGALVGAGAALAVLLQPPTGWNMAAVAGVLWLLALVSVAPSLVSTGPAGTVRLGVLEPASLDAATAQRLALVILPLVALLVGAATGALARWRGHPPLVSGATGAAGPVLLAFAYLTAGPGDTADRYQLTPYYAALLAVAAGALGSTAAALLRWPLVRRTAPSGAIRPTDILRPLPTGPALPRTRATTGDDEAETVGLTGAALADAARSGGAGSGGIAAPAPAGFSPVPRAVPPHWDWPAAGGTTPAHTTDAGTDANPSGTAGSPAPASYDPPRIDGPTALHAPAGAEPATRNEVDGHAPTGPASPTGRGPAAAATTADQPTGAATPTAGPAEAAAFPAQPVEAVTPAGPPVEGPTPAKQAEVVASEQAAPSPPKPRRTRKPRSTRQPDATVAPQGTDPVPDTADAPTAKATAPTVSPEPRGDSAPTATPTSTPPSAETSAPASVPAATPPSAPADQGSPATPGAVSPAAPTWPAPPQLPGAFTAEAVQPVADPATEPTPRPRHRALMPDLARAASWEALATARQGGPVPPPAETAPGGGTRSAGAEAAPNDPAVPVEAAQPAGRTRSRLGLFRRNRARVEDTPADQEGSSLPAQDEEYVDWVNGLSKPVPDNEPEQESGRRSLRSTGRHHRN